MKVIPEDYDNLGRLKLPVLFWGVLLLQARTWVLFVMAGASNQQGNALLALFYPDHTAFWSGLLSGGPAMAAFFLCPRRHLWVVLWRCWYWVLTLMQAAMFAWSGFLVMKGENNFLLLLVGIMDGLALYWLLSNRRLRQCFATPQAF